jgi:hypothetical protein
MKIDKEDYSTTKQATKRFKITSEPYYEFIMQQNTEYQKPKLGGLIGF